MLEIHFSSKAMEDRNKLFRKAHALLVEEGASKEEARALVKETLRQGRRPSGGSSSSSGKGRRPRGEVVITRGEVGCLVVELVMIQGKMVSYFVK